MIGMGILFRRNNVLTVPGKCKNIKNMDAYDFYRDPATDKQRGITTQVIRVMTYNIHGCVDRTRAVNPARIADIIEGLQADIIALQEVDAQKPMDLSTNQAKFLAQRLEMEHFFFPIEKSSRHTFGLAVLSRFPLGECHYDFLPNIYPGLNPRKRGIILACIRIPGGRLTVINVHLSLYKLERRKQLKALLGNARLASAFADQPVILCGDLNAGPLSATYRTLSRRLTDVQKDIGNRRAAVYQPTFHSRSPLFRIDHIFVSSHFRTLKVEVNSTPATRSASDHLPLTADLALKA